MNGNGYKTKKIGFYSTGNQKSLMTSKQQNENLSYL